MVECVLQAVVTVQSPAYQEANRRYWVSVLGIILSRTYYLKWNYMTESNFFDDVIALIDMWRKPFSYLKSA